MKIARNILLRNKAKKTLEKKHEGFFPIERLDNGAQSILEKRLNQNLRNRLQTMLSYNNPKAIKESEYSEKQEL